MRHSLGSYTNYEFRNAADTVCNVELIVYHGANNTDRSIQMPLRLQDGCFGANRDWLCFVLRQV